MLQKEAWFWSDNMNFLEWIFCFHASLPFLIFLETATKRLNPLWDSIKKFLPASSISTRRRAFCKSRTRKMSDTNRILRQTLKEFNKCFVFVEIQSKMRKIKYPEFVNDVICEKILQNEKDFFRIHPFTILSEICEGTLIIFFLLWKFILFHSIPFSLFQKCFIVFIFSHEWVFVHKSIPF